MERNMAGEFVIEALEPRQLLSSTPTTTAPPATTVAATMTVTVATTSATSTTGSATITSTSTTATTPTDTGKKPAFVRPGSSAPTDTSELPQGSNIPWGTDIYPPPIFT